MKITKRNFIKKTALLVSYGIVINPLKKLLASNIVKQKLPSWVELVETARWAPSVHNLQPHKLKIISATQAELYYDTQRLLPVEDPQSTFATVALGIFIEHLSIAASPYNMKVKATTIHAPVNMNNHGYVLFASLQLTPNDVKEELYPELITKRRTSRLHYNGIALNNDTLSKIDKQAKAFNHEFIYSNEKKFIDSIIELNEQTLFEDISGDNTRNELNHLFRYSEEEAAHKRDGLWSRCMGFPGLLVKSVLRHHNEWDYGWKKNLLSNYYRKSFKGTSTICWFGGTFNNTTDWLNAGHMLARNWLLLTKENAYIQPFGSLITNEKAYKKINEVFTQPSAGKQIWMVFRAGYSKVPTRSFRLNTNEIIIA